jgi:MraZ protein
MLTAKRACLAIYPHEKFLEKVQALVIASERGVHAAEKLLRITSGYGMPCPVDRQGRILIPSSHQDYAELRREIMFVGLETHMEIWDRALHAEHIALVRENLDEFEEQVRPDLKEIKG